MGRGTVLGMAKTFRAQVLGMAEQETRGWKMMIGGQWVEAKSGKRYTTLDPSFDAPIADMPDADARDIDATVAAAKGAFPAWSRLHVDERAKMLKGFAGSVRKLARELGLLDAVDSGNPFASMVDDAVKGAGLHDFFCGLGMEIKGQTISTPGGGLDYTRPQPFGVVARILPYNHPVSSAVGKIAAPLVAGNTVVLKPAEQTPLSALLIGKLAWKRCSRRSQKSAWASPSARKPRWGRSLRGTITTA